MNTGLCVENKYTNDVKTLLVTVQCETVGHVDRMGVRMAWSVVVLIHMGLGVPL